MTVVAEGPSYAISLDGDRGELRIWRRPDLSSADGARITDNVPRALGGLLPKVRSPPFDLRAAPAVSGPTTLDALGTLARACEHAKIRIAAVVSDDAMQRLQVNRVVKECAPQSGRVFSAIEDAEPWLTRS